MAKLTRNQISLEEEADRLPFIESNSPRRLPWGVRKDSYRFEGIWNILWNVEVKRLKRSIGKSYAMYYHYVCKKYKEFRFLLEDFLKRQFHPEPWQLRYGHYFYIDEQGLIQHFKRPRVKRRGPKPYLTKDKVKLLKKEKREHKKLYPWGSSKTREEWDLYLKQEKLKHNKTCKQPQELQNGELQQYINTN